MDIMIHNLCKDCYHDCKQNAKLVIVKCARFEGLARSEAYKDGIPDSNTLRKRSRALLRAKVPSSGVQGS